MDKELYEEYKKMIYYIIKKIGIKYNEDEYYSVGELALAKALNTYDETKNCKLTTYIFNCVEFAILNEIRYKTLKKRSHNFTGISLDKEINDNNKVYDFISNGINIEKDFIKIEEIELLNKIIEILEPKDRYIINHFYAINGYKKMTKKELAEKFKVKPEHIGYIIQKNFKIIRKIMKDKLSESEG